jgi:tetratricopeptide (TPR) repeat protein
LSGLYFLAPTVGPKPEVAPPEKKEADLESIASALASSLAEPMRDSIESLDNAGKSLAWDRLGHVHVAAWYAELAAQESSTASEWVEVGNKYLIAYSSGIDTSIKPFLLERGREAFIRASELEPDNLNTKVSLAACYLEDQAQVMKGVTTLLDVVATDSAHIQANLMLGKWGLVSQQYEKAIKRLKFVVSLRPENLEALFLLGQAHEELGDAVKAEEYFDLCRKIVEKKKTQ